MNMNTNTSETREEKSLNEDLNGKAPAHHTPGDPVAHEELLKLSYRLAGTVRHGPAILEDALV
jgi:hypothetical protein